MLYFRLALALPLAVSCESSSHVDCPALDLDACLANRPACLWAGFPSDGDCRNTCDLAEPDCEDGLSCEDTDYYIPDLLEHTNPPRPLPVLRIRSC